MNLVKSAVASGIHYGISSGVSHVIHKDVVSGLKRAKTRIRRVNDSVCSSLEDETVTTQPQKPKSKVKRIVHKLKKALKTIGKKLRF